MKNRSKSLFLPSRRLGFQRGLVRKCPFLVKAVILWSITVGTVLSGWPQSTLGRIHFGGKEYPLFPKTLDENPQLPSPLTTSDGSEILTVSTKSDKWALVPVTVENGSPLHYSSRVGTQFGKDRQLQVDSGDFPVLAETGLHSESNLDRKEKITGYPVSLISYIGRPGRFSGTGFLAVDEDIISVLKGDNRIVRRLGLTHPQLAKPLFHLWNLILKEIEAGTMKRFPSVQRFNYNGEWLEFTAEGGKGWQVSIFQDEIQGRFDIRTRRGMNSDERSVLSAKFPRLTPDQLQDLEEKLSTIRFSEMAPYYIMRYGFYEGHTAYRSDPIAITYVFGLMSLEEIIGVFPENLHSALTVHFNGN